MSTDSVSSFLPVDRIERKPNLCSFYFTRLSVDEEQVYSSIPQALVGEIRAEIRDIPDACRLIEIYKEIANVDLLTLLNSVRSDVSDVQMHKLYQTGLHALLAMYLRSRLNLQVEAVGFYSGGATSAFLFAGAYTGADYIRHIFPFNKIVREKMITEGQHRNLTQVLLIGDVENDLEGFVCSFLNDHHDFSETFVKDRRQSHALLVAGPLEQISRLVEETESRFPSVARRRSPILKHRFASHSPYLDAEALSADLDEKLFSLPWTTIVGSRGEILPPDRTSSSRLKKIFADGVIGPMNTGNAIERLAQHNRKILVIGSAHAAKVLAGLELLAGVSIDLAPEFAVQADSRVLGKPIYDGRVTEYVAG